jgi:hypothetical protein
MKSEIDHGGGRPKVLLLMITSTELSDSKDEALVISTKAHHSENGSKQKSSLIFLMPRNIVPFPQRLLCGDYSRGCPQAHHVMSTEFFFLFEQGVLVKRNGQHVCKVAY